MYGGLSCSCVPSVVVNRTIRAVVDMRAMACVADCYAARLCTRLLSLMFYQFFLEPSPQPFYYLCGRIDRPEKMRKGGPPPPGNSSIRCFWVLGHTSTAVPYLFFVPTDIARLSELSCLFSSSQPQPSVVSTCSRTCISCQVLSIYPASIERSRDRNVLLNHVYYCCCRPACQRTQVSIFATLHQRHTFYYMKKL